LSSNKLLLPERERSKEGLRRAIKVLSRKKNPRVRVTTLGMTWHRAPRNVLNVLIKLEILKEQNQWSRRTTMATT
jgi:hypothetical protein